MKIQKLFMLHFVVAVLVMTVVIGDAAASEPKKKKKATPLPPAAAARPTNGSLFTDNGRNVELFSDFKPRAIGDVIYVEIVESSAASVSSSASSSRESGTLGGAVIGAAPLPTQIAGAAVGVVGALGTREFDGEGSTGRTTTLRARIAARVVEVLPNGDLRIEAEKRLKINKEDERLTLSGLVRVRDVSTNSSIPSTSVADLDVRLNGKGVASANNAPGWLARFLEKISPF